MSTPQTVSNTDAVTELSTQSPTTNNVSDSFADLVSGSGLQPVKGKAARIAKAASAMIELINKEEEEIVVGNARPVNAGKRWTPEELASLISDAGTQSVDELAAKYGRSPFAIECQLFQHVQKQDDKKVSMDEIGMDKEKYAELEQRLITDRPPRQKTRKSVTEDGDEPRAKSTRKIKPRRQKRIPKIRNTSEDKITVDQHEEFTGTVLAMIEDAITKHAVEQNWMELDDYDLKLYAKYMESMGVFIDYLVHKNKVAAGVPV